MAPSIAISDPVVPVPGLTAHAPLASKAPLSHPLDPLTPSE